MNISNTIIAYKVIKDISRKWVDFKAYQLGLINELGEKIKSPLSADEKDAYDSYHKMIFNMKRILQRFVGKNQTVQQLTTMFLLKEGFESKQIEMVLESLDLPSDTETINKHHGWALIESVIE
jgi:hypothetical protein